MSMPIFQGILIGHVPYDENKETVREYLTRVREQIKAGEVVPTYAEDVTEESLLAMVDQIMVEVDAGDREPEGDPDFRVFVPCTAANDQWLEIMPDGSFEIGVPAG